MTKLKEESVKAPVISQERIQAVEQASMAGTVAYHPLQELPVPAEFYFQMMEVIQQVMNDETEEVVQTIPIIEGGKVVRSHIQPVTNQSKRAYLCANILKTASKLGIAYYENGLTTVPTALKDVYDKVRAGKGLEIEAIPVPGAPKAYTQGYFQAELEKPSEPEPQMEVEQEPTTNA